VITGFLIYKGDGFGPVVLIVFGRYSSVIPAHSSSLFTSTPSPFTMSDIYTHEPVQDFTNPFLDFDQGYVRPFATILPTIKVTLIPIPSEDESVLPKKPLTRKEIKTRRGYPRGESQGESSGRILLPSLFDQNVEEFFYRVALL